MYKIHINDRNYQSWDIYNSDTLEKVDNINVDPIVSKLFTNDIFFIDQNGVHIVHSSIRSSSAIPAVLVIDGNKTYGREKGKSGKLYYKCIPDDKRLPAFLVPYEMKNVGFSKVFNDLYVTINFHSWDDKHPVAKLDSVIGAVNIIENFYEYQLYCKSLNASISKFQKDTRQMLGNGIGDNLFSLIREKYPEIEDRMGPEWNVITIDPLNSMDFDDGFSIKEHVEGSTLLTIYISNVTIMLDFLNLWNSFSRRISTIYLPDKKRPMLPTILSDQLCSLQEKCCRVAFAMDIIVKDGFILDISYHNAFINVRKNYVYEEPSLLGDPAYHALLDLTQGFSKNYKYINSVKNSHDMVSYLMILMNYHCAKKLMEYRVGVFRATVMKRAPNASVPDSLPEEVGKFIKIWSNTAGQYVDGSSIHINESDMRHELLDLDAYVHITSPIRRLVDLLNMIKLQSVLNTITLTNEASQFYDKWLNEMEYINTTMRSIRKVQMDCSLLDLCYNDPATLNAIYDGYLFDKVMRNDGLYQYMVYLPNIKMTSKLTLREEYDNYTCQQFKLFLFNDEDRFKKKIRLSIHL